MRLQVRWKWEGRDFLGYLWRVPGKGVEVWPVPPGDSFGPDDVELYRSVLSVLPNAKITEVPTDE